MTLPRNELELDPGGPRFFSVTIFYREPNYARGRGIPDREYRGTFNVTATSEDEAVRLATTQFREAAQRSSVSWTREITRIVFNPLIEASTTDYTPEREVERGDAAPNHRPARSPVDAAVEATAASDVLAAGDGAAEGNLNDRSSRAAVDHQPPAAREALNARPWLGRAADLVFGTALGIFLARWIVPVVATEFSWALPASLVLLSIWLHYRSL
jgi:hypothetical protein